MPGLYKFKLDRTNRRLTPRTYNLSPNFFCLELMIYCHLATWTSTFFVCETFLFESIHSVEPFCTLHFQLKLVLNWFK